MSRRDFLGGASSHGSNSQAPQRHASLPDEMLLQTCCASVVEGEAMPEWLETLRCVPRLIGGTRQASHLELALTMLASLLGELPRHNPTHLPFGFGGPRVHSHHWIDHETLDRIGKQVVGLVRHDDAPDTIAVTVECAIAEAIRLGFLDQKQYDAWRPGMPSGSGWRAAVMATPYGVTKARGLASVLVEHEPNPAAKTNVNNRTTAPNGPARNDKQRPKSEYTSPIGPSPSGLTNDQNQPSVAAVDKPYTWARQIELVNATNQVLGEGTLNKGVLSRACRMKRLETNGKPGRASRISVSGFLTWAVGQFSISGGEQVQLRNAVIGEIHGRNL